MCVWGGCSGGVACILFSVGLVNKQPVLFCTECDGISARVYFSTFQLTWRLQAERNIKNTQGQREEEEEEVCWGKYHHRKTKESIPQLKLKNGTKERSKKK